MSIYSYIFDFMSILFDKLEDKSKIRNIILFGSQAREEARKDSDIDIFIDVESRNIESVEKIVRDTLNEFEIKAQKSWHLRGINNSIVPIIDNIKDDKWNELKREISNHSIILYGKYESDSVRDKHFVLITYNISKLKQKDKMKTIRQLYGYKLSKGKTIYSNKGLADELNAEKISSGVLAKIENYKQIYDFLHKNRVPFKIREI